MPPLKFVEVLTYSSEDPNHPAKNLLKPDTYLKWKSEAGQKDHQEYVVLKLEQLSSIHSIDIGNENSAFIEVLVSRDGTDFKILLVASAFMSPLEARNGSSSNRVRMFAYDKLNENIATQKWDRIKVICTQPFIKTAQYGLTFIKVYGPENKENSDSETNLGKFIIREEEDDDTLSVGSFFSKRGESFSFSLEDGNQNIKRSLEDASSSNAQSSGFYQLKKKIKESSEKRGNSPTPKPPKLKNEKDEILTIKENKKAEKPIVRENKKIEKPTNKLTEKQNRDDKRPARPTSRNNHSSAAKAAPPTPAAKVKMKRKSRPFKKLMNDVVFVMSGYQNPKRSQLRDALLDMGAKYKADWGPGCTHLICAFKNTPKFQQVKGKGKIVNEKWVDDSVKKKIRLPWRRYNLEKDENDESEEEIWASEICSSPENEDVPESQGERPNDADETVDSEDTDDELQRAMQNNNKKDKSQDVSKETGANSRKRPAPTKETGSNNSKIPAQTDQRSASTDQRHTPNDPSSDREYDADTDVDEDIERKDTSNIPLSPLKNMFGGKKMYIFGSCIDETKRKTLERYIIACQGTVSNYMSEGVNFVITDDCWDENFDNALEDNPSLQFVKSQWIWKCCNAEKMVPPQPYLVVPKETI